MLTPAYNRMARTSAAALKTLIRATGGAEIVKIGGRDYSAFVTAINSGGDPISGGILQAGEFTVMVAKADHPTRPQDNEDIIYKGRRMVAQEVTDRQGYWAILAGSELE